MKKRKKSVVIADFRRAAQSDYLLGNHFSELAATGDASVCSYLRKLKASKGWSDDGPEPWGNWVTVVCTWLEKGGEGLMRLSRSADRNHYVSMSLSILAACRSRENLAWMARIIPLRFQLGQRPTDFEIASGWVNDLIRAFTSGRPFQIDPSTEDRLRRFAHSFLTKGLAKAKRNKGRDRRYSRDTPNAAELFYFIPGLRLLAYVGNEMSLELVDRIPRSHACSLHDSVKSSIRARRVESGWS